MSGQIPSDLLKEELKLLDPTTLRLFIDKFQDLNLETDGKCFNKLTALRIFPLSAECQFIVLKDADDKDVGIIPDIAQLNPENRRIIESVLERTYFTARITQINAIEEEFHIPKWDVETDRGPRIFEVGSTRRDLRVMEAGRVLVRDADGNRYEIPDYRKLDPFSRMLIETLI